MRSNVITAKAYHLRQDARKHKTRHQVHEEYHNRRHHEIRAITISGTFKLANPRTKLTAPYALLSRGRQPSIYSVGVLANVLGIPRLRRRLTHRHLQVEEALGLGEFIDALGEASQLLCLNP